MAASLILHAKLSLVIWTSDGGQFPGWPWSGNNRPWDHGAGEGWAPGFFLYASRQSQNGWVV